MQIKAFFSALVRFFDKPKAFAKKHWRLFDALGTVALLILALYLLLYFIAGPALAYFTSDCADSLLWAQATVESGKLLTEDFDYAALLPFGASVWMVPVLKIFGYTMTAQNISMAVFAVLFVLSAFSLFRAMKWNGTASAGSTLILVMLLSGSVKMREIMWQHVIYYSLGLLFFILLLNLYLRLMDCIRQLSSPQKRVWDYIRFALLALCLFGLCIGCGMDGMQILVLCVIPVMGSCFVVVFLDGSAKLFTKKTISQYLMAIVMGIGAVIGLMILNHLTMDGKIAAGYEDGYSVWSWMHEWWPHAETLLPEYLLLFGVEADGGAPLFTLDSVFTLFQLISALVVFFCPLLLLLRYRKLQRDSSRAVAWAHLFLSAVLLLGFICGALAAGNWRLVPMVGSCIIATLVYLRELWDDKAFARRIAVVLIAILLITTGYHGKLIKEMPADAGDNQKYITITQTLAEKGYTTGYATFWNAVTATLIADSQVRVLTVNVTNDYGITPTYYQSMKQWYTETEDWDDHFVILSEQEYSDIFETMYWNNQLTENTVLDELHIEGYVIFVFKNSPLPAPEI